MIFSASKNRWIDFIKLLESEKIIFSTYRISQPWATIKQQLYSSNNMETPINLSWNYTADGSIRVNIASNVHESTWKQNLSSLDFMRNKTPTKSIKGYQYQDTTDITTVMKDINGLPQLKMVPQDDVITMNNEWAH